MISILESLCVYYQILAVVKHTLQKHNQQQTPKQLMQEDPNFMRMYKKSFILQQYDDLEVPMVKKNATIKHHILTTFMLSSFIHFLIYPLDTIKTRLIASNKVTDIAKFQFNKTKNQTAYLGIFRGYFAVLVGSACHLALGRQNFVQGAIVEGILKTWIQMIKISKQMANPNSDLQIMKKTMGVATLYAILRDITFRGSYFLIFTKLNQKFLKQNKFDEQLKLNHMFFSTVLATLISQPLQVCFTKIASQRQLKYTNLFKIPIQIIKQQGYGKFLVSGLWARITFNLISTSILYNSYDKFLQASLEAI